MNKVSCLLLSTVLCLLSATSVSYGQTDSIVFELNGRAPNDRLISEGHAASANPFARFVGDWTLRDDRWIQNWGGNTDTIQIPGHHTVTRVLNTENSLLSIIDGPEPNGHIFWSYNPVTGQIHHSSSFGASRVGLGEGRVDSVGNVYLKISFEGEAPGTYRRYAYIWVNDDEYNMRSVQYDEKDRPTGLFYEGRFVRTEVGKTAEEKVRREILANGATIRKAFFEGDIALIESLHHPDVVKALSYGDVKYGRAQVMDGVRDVLQDYVLEFVENEVESILVQGNTAIEQSRFSIRGTPKAGGDPFVFSGRTMVTYVRYHDSPTGWATIREIIQPVD